MSDEVGFLTKIIQEGEAAANANVHGQPQHPVLEGQQALRQIPLSQGILPLTSILSCLRGVPALAVALPALAVAILDQTSALSLLQVYWQAASQHKCKYKISLQ